jgi:hypothetical protein
MLKSPRTEDLNTFSNFACDFLITLSLFLTERIIETAIMGRYSCLIEGKVEKLKLESKSR